MNREEAIRKLEYSKKAYQTLIDEKVDSGKLVGKDVRGEWKADTPLDEAYKSMIDALEMAIKALEQELWTPVSERLPEAGEYIGDVAKYYLVQNEYEDMLVARYTYGKYWEQIYQLKPIGDEIVAWMPLPKPYELKGSEEV